MYNEIFNQDDFESEFPTPKEGPSLDEMMRRYGFIIFKEWSKANQEGKNKNV